MYIETTANIDVVTYRTIKTTAKMLGVSARRLVHVLLKIVVREMPFDYRLYRTVEYQADRPVVDWKCFHLRLTGVVYESSHDMRKLMKYSVSFLLCYAVRVYLEKAVKILTEDVNLDSYPDIYCISAIHTEEISTFTIFHTFPEEKDLPRHFTHRDEYT
jgi:E3 ubiquitin-protein ligase DOA10